MDTDIRLLNSSQTYTAETIVEINSTIYNLTHCNHLPYWWRRKWHTYFKALTAVVFPVDLSKHDHSVHKDLVSTQPPSSYLDMTVLGMKQWCLTLLSIPIT